MKKNKRQKHVNNKILEISSKILFPGITELQYLVIFFALLLTLFINFFFVDFALKMLLIMFALLLYPMVILALAIFTKAKFEAKYKAWICLVYYLCFALSAIFALEQQNQVSEIGKSSLENINLLLTKAISIILIIRGFIAFSILKLGEDFNDLTHYMTKNFKDHQYTYIAFITTFTTTLMLMLILNIFYDEVITIFFITVVYSMGVLRIIERLVPDIFRHN